MNAAPKLKERFSYADYLNWPDDERWEIIDGIAYDMSPAPTPRHQNVSMKLSLMIGNFLEGKPCDIYAAPFDVKLSDETMDELVDTVIQPDLSVICDMDRLDERGYNGAPTLVVEILSKSTASKDLAEKYFLYEKHGVKEYLIVNTWAETVTSHQLDEQGQFSHPTTYSNEDHMPVSVLAGLTIDLSKVFK